MESATIWWNGWYAPVHSSIRYALQIRRYSSAISAGSRSPRTSRIASLMAELDQRSVHVERSELRVRNGGLLMGFLLIEPGSWSDSGGAVTFFSLRLRRLRSCAALARLSRVAAGDVGVAEPEACSTTQKVSLDVSVLEIGTGIALKAPRDSKESLRPCLGGGLHHSSPRGSPCPPHATPEADRSPNTKRVRYVWRPNARCRRNRSV